MTKDELFAPVKEMIGKIVDPTRKKSMQNAFDALTEDYVGINSWTLEQAQALKRDLAKFTPSKLYRGQEVASEVRTLQHEMANAIRQKTYNSLRDVNIKQDYLDYANLSELENVGVKAISEAGLHAGFGGFWSTIYDMATTPIKTIGGKTLYRVGNLFEFVGEKGIKTFGEFLKKQGFNKP
ncbi:MAG: hypothetical protein DDT19_01191 [Syntrophomonadaceae bacterium]|nr:hypothetical protein [Bacillota bacterium]